MKKVIMGLMFLVSLGFSTEIGDTILDTFDFYSYTLCRNQKT